MDVGNQDKTKFPTLPETAFYRQITRTKQDLLEFLGVLQDFMLRSVIFSRFASIS